MGANVRFRGFVMRGSERRRRLRRVREMPEGLIDLDSSRSVLAEGQKAIRWTHIGFISVSLGARSVRGGPLRGSVQVNRADSTFPNQD